MMVKCSLHPWVMVKIFTPHHGRWWRYSFRTMDDGEEIQSTPWWWW
jgi:hypothetical protein